MSDRIYLPATEPRARFTWYAVPYRVVFYCSGLAGVWIAAVRQTKTGRDFKNGEGFRMTLDRLALRMEGTDVAAYISELASPPVDTPPGPQTDREAAEFLHTALGDAVDDHDVTAILDELHTRYQTWDLESIPTEDFWETVSRHPFVPQVRP